MTWVLALIVTAFVNLLIAECFDWLPWLAKKVIHAAARYLPAEHRERYEGEWLAELDEVPGLRLSRLIFALRILRSAVAVRTALNPAMPGLYLGTPLKRLVDVIGAAILVATLVPMLAVIALAIRLTSPGPVFFREQRIGFEGETFGLFRFRTVAVVSDDRGLWRPTRLGHYLRRYSLDELPQLFNVLLGDMSLVGPRPLRPSDVAMLEEWQKGRHRVRPGITGLWQTASQPFCTFEEMIRLDLAYLDGWHPLRDLRILLDTIRAVFRRCD